MSCCATCRLTLLNAAYCYPLRGGTSPAKRADNLVWVGCCVTGAAFPLNRPSRSWLDERAEHRDHPLHNNWEGFRECHIKSDWLLVYQVIEDTLVLSLAHTGAHSDLDF